MGLQYILETQWDFMGESKTGTACMETNWETDRGTVAKTL